MKWLRNPQYSAMLLLGSAVLGLVVANTALGPALQELKHSHLPFAIGGLDLSLAHWVTDGLLVVFFFVAAIELRFEITQGELNSPKKATIPTIAAVGGVVVPAMIYLIVAGSDFGNGWPIPTATDIAFALGVLAIFGKRLPSAVRALLLALAVIDDLIAILIIAFFFTSDLQPLPLLASAITLGAFAWLGTLYRSTPKSVLLRIALPVTAVLTWYLVALSGIHATIAGVALGLVLTPAAAETARHKLEGFSNGFVLPVFAFVAASVTIPDVPIGALTSMFWAIVIALPLGKLIGITLAGRLGEIAMRVPKPERMPLSDFITVALLGGIGFTVSLLMNELAHRSSEELITEGTLGVLVASLIATVLGGGFAAIRSLRIRARTLDEQTAERERDEAAFKARYDGE